MPLNSEPHMVFRVVVMVVVVIVFLFSPSVGQDGYRGVQWARFLLLHGRLES